VIEHDPWRIQHTGTRVLALWIVTRPLLRLLTNALGHALTAQ
jgi:hypothetical protein